MTVACDAPPPAPMSPPALARPAPSWDARPLPGLAGMRAAALVLVTNAALGLYAAFGVPHAVGGPPTPGFGSGSLDVVLAFFMLVGGKGAAAARTWTIVRALLGAVLLTALGLALEDAAGIVAQLVVSGLLLGLLLGRAGWLRISICLGTYALFAHLTVVGGASVRARPGALGDASAGGYSLGR